MHIGPSSLRFDNENPGEFSAIAKLESHEGFQEVRVTIYDKDQQPVANILVGLDGETRQPVILITTDGYAEHPAIAVFPLKPTSQAVETNWL